MYLPLYYQLYNGCTGINTKVLELFYVILFFIKRDRVNTTYCIRSFINRSNESLNKNLAGK